MRLSRVFLNAMLVSTLLMFGCGDDSGDVCAGCETQAQREQCNQRLAGCSTFTDPGARDVCVATAADVCL